MRGFNINFTGVFMPGCWCVVKFAVGVNGVCVEMVRFWCTYIDVTTPSVGDIIIVKCRHKFGVLESVITTREVRAEHIIFMQSY
jgi:hypothetical protein